MVQKIYPQDEHQLALKEIDADALFVLGKLKEAGYIAYLVGGGVRDLLLKRKPKDYDISTSAKPEEIKKLFRNCILIGRRFRLAHIRFGKKVLEVSTFRTGETETEELIVRDNEWGSPEEDVRRRDFTINGLFYDASNQTIIDYVGGYPDIQKKYLRTIGQPYLRFKQDPVRMIRMLKFQARFGFEVDPDARVALLDCRGEIIKSSQARILEEIFRMLESGSGESFIRLMTENGMMQLLLPALASFLETKEGDEVYAYLREIDEVSHERDLDEPTLDRSLLLSSLLFPYLQKHLQVRYLEREKIPHLGEIHQEANSVVDEIFRPFFVLPRRIRITLTSILTSQYRLTPIEKKRPVQLRIPHDPDFPLALQFLSLRSYLEPGLKKIWEDWNDIYLSPNRPAHKPRKRRRRR
jgi:poly(A) polymerase